MPYSQDLKEKQANQATRVVFEDSGGRDKPNFVCAAHERQWELAEVVRDVYKGTFHMRKKGETYLPKLEVESETAYKKRLAKAKLFNATRRTADGLTGMVFRKPPVIEAPKKLEDYTDNVDLAGRDLSMFAKDVFLAGMQDGISFVYVDFPPAEPRKSKAEDEALQLRPFFRHVELHDLINWQWDTVNGSPFLTLAVIKENAVEPIGQFGETSVTRYRVLRPGQYELWEEQNTDGKRTWTVVEEGPVSLPYIPLFPFYARRVDFMEGEPPLSDLAYENVGHWELSSEREKSRSIAHIPLLSFMGFPDDAEIKISSQTGLRNSNADAKVEWVVYEGQALGESRQDLRDIEGRMATLGLSLLLSRPSPQGSDDDVTATGDLLRKSESDSTLSTAAYQMDNCLTQAFKAMADFVREREPGTVEVNKDFRDQQIDPQALAVLSQMVSEGKISLDTLWDIMEQGESLPEDFDRDVERDRLEVAL